MSISAEPPRLIIAVNRWSLFHRFPESGPTPLSTILGEIAEAGFEAFTWVPDLPDLKRALGAAGLRYGGFFVADRREEVAGKIEACLEVGEGPINCFVGHHSTRPAEAIEIAEEIWSRAERLGARVHVEVHRNTATETPEKLAAILQEVRARGHCQPLINFDFSHHALVKHLEVADFADRLWTDESAFQAANLWHVRPFNGQHCQLPVTDGAGGWSAEYEAFRPFVRDGFRRWLAGPRPQNELWVVPELGTSLGYALSCFPDIWEDTIALGRDLQAIWAQVLAE